MIFLTNPCSTISILRLDYYRRIMFFHFSEEVQTLGTLKSLMTGTKLCQSIWTKKTLPNTWLCRLGFSRKWNGLRKRLRKWATESCEEGPKEGQGNEGSEKGNLITALINTITSHELLHLKLEWCQLGTGFNWLGIRSINSMVWMVIFQAW